MANYTKTTDFAAKDALATGNTNKIVRGSEIDNEFANIQTAVNSKADLLSPALTGTPTAPTATLGTSTTQVATTAFVLQHLYPVGSVYINAGVDTNPAVLFGFGTWEAFGAGKVLVGQDTGDTSFDTLEETGGSKDAVVVSHNHTTGSAGSHTHSITQWTGSADDSQDTGGTYTGMNTSLPFTAYPAGVVISTAPNHTHTVSTEGVSATNKNLQPYVVVKMWKRTA